MAICLRYATQEVDALDILNTGFLKVFKNIHTYKGSKGALYTWIKQIVINTGIDFIRKKKLVFEQEVSGSEDSFFEQAEVIGKMEADSILRMLKMLPPATQAVFNLYAIDGFSHIEIAKILGISEGTSRWHLSDARKKLQNLLKEYDA